MIDLLPAAPDPATDIPQDFNKKAAALVLAQKTMVVQINAATAALSAMAAGGAFSLPYTVDLTSTADADPTPFFMRFNAAQQNAATAIYLDLIGADGIDYTNIIDQFDASTSAVKGHLRVVKIGDPVKMLTFAVLARTTATGYRKLTLLNLGGSAASPFGQGDGVLLQFTRAGDRGVGGGFTNLVVITSTQTWTPPSGVTKAEFTICDGGQAGYTQTSGGGLSGKGGNTSVSVRDVSSAVTYTVAVGAGGVAAGAQTSVIGASGGASSVSGTGLTTLTSANGDLKIAGAYGIRGFGNGYAGASFFNLAGDDTGYGAAGAGAADGAAGKNGRAGVVVIRY